MDKLNSTFRPFSTHYWANTDYWYFIYNHWPYVYHRTRKHNQMCCAPIRYTWSLSSLFYNKNTKYQRKNTKHHLTVVLKKFDDVHLLSELDTDLERFVAKKHHTVDEDFVALHSIIMKHFDKHAPVKRWRVKYNRLPEWYTSDIGQYAFKEINVSVKNGGHSTSIKRLQNKISSLVHDAKHKHLTVSVEKQKDSKALWKHFRETLWCEHY